MNEPIEQPSPEQPAPGQAENPRKPTRAELAKRITTIVRLLVLGMKPDAIWRYVSSDEEIDWNISPRTLDRYIQKATAIIESAESTNRELEIGMSKLRLEELFERNMRIQDYKAALAVVKERAALLGLAEPTKIKATIQAAKTWVDFITTDDSDEDEASSSADSDLDEADPNDEYTTQPG